jgi:hypothetical protein
MPTDPERFDAAVRKILSVPRETLKQREEAWKKDRESAKKKRAKTSPASRASVSSPKRAT